MSEQILSITDELNHKGHRERLRARFAKAPASLPDYEILELLLCLALPRQDVKPLAKTILKHFKTLQEIVCSDLEALIKIKNLGKNTALSIKLVHEILQRVLQEPLKHTPLLNNQEKVVNYLKVSIAYSQNEQFRVLFLNKKQYLILDEIQQHGTIDHATLYIREIIKRGLDLNSSQIILVHNHPTGDPTPSKADIETTLLLQEAAQPMGITLLDHLIIGRYGFFSMRDQNLL